MQRPYKITYKTYFNDRLKEVDFHGEQTYPLYIQITYRKKTIFFKSYYFDLLSRERYAHKNGKKIVTPKLDDIIGFELKLIQFIVEKLEESITLEAFKKAYIFYSHDLCSYIEKVFSFDLSAYFKDIDCFSFAWATASFNQKSSVLYNFLQDMKKLFTDDAWNKLVQYCNRVKIPYLEIYAFIKSVCNPIYLFLTAMEWEKGEIAEEFKAYLASTKISRKEQDKIIHDMNKLVADLKEQMTLWIY